ncbi:hypothetical protein J6590_057448 [Homalodisca vitripennis]|nr:hypothetical protein J6590_057448 [Homalodisca vitripennis]
MASSVVLEESGSGGRQQVSEGVTVASGSQGLEVHGSHRARPAVIEPVRGAGYSVLNLQRCIYCHTRMPEERDTPCSICNVAFIVTRECQRSGILRAQSATLHLLSHKNVRRAGYTVLNLKRGIYCHTRMSEERDTPCFVCKIAFIV